MNHSFFSNDKTPTHPFLTLDRFSRESYVKRNKSQFRMSGATMSDCISAFSDTGCIQTFVNTVVKGKCFDYTSGKVSPRIRRFLDGWYDYLMSVLPDSDKSFVRKGKFKDTQPDRSYVSNCVVFNLPNDLRFCLSHDHIDIHIPCITSSGGGRGSWIINHLLNYCDIFKNDNGFCPTIRCECMGSLWDSYSKDKPNIEGQLRFFQRLGFVIDKVADGIHFLSYQP